MKLEWSREVGVKFHHVHVAVIGSVRNQGACLGCDSRWRPFLKTQVSPGEAFAVEINLGDASFCSFLLLSRRVEV